MALNVHFELSGMYGILQQTFKISNLEAHGFVPCDVRGRIMIYTNWLKVGYFHNNWPKSLYSQESSIKYKYLLHESCKITSFTKHQFYRSAFIDFCNTCRLSIHLSTTVGVTITVSLTPPPHLARRCWYFKSVCMLVSWCGSPSAGMWCTMSAPTCLWRTWMWYWLRSICHWVQSASKKFAQSSPYFSLSPLSLWT